MNALTRRSLLAGAAAATVCGTAAVSATGPHPDAELIATYAEFVACDIGITSTVNDDESDEQRDARFDRWVELMDDIVARKASTTAGLAVLALAALKEGGAFEIPGVAWDGYSKPRGIESGDRAHRILWNIVESARAMTAY
ncbi:hypothetical protein [Phaeospirillum tilakii]|uniref:Tat (Twin-arginine translocation) pathway signal sequence n=1 Tax=Phaeospirillum tilakii TaxID=741673 RepID=A0ABW5CDX9_9PROT